MTKETQQPKDTLMIQVLNAVQRLRRDEQTQEDILLLLKHSELADKMSGILCRSKP